MLKHWLVMDDGPGPPYRARIASAGRYLPPTHLSTDELMASTRHHTRIDLERLTGIREREVFDAEGITLSDVSHVITHQTSARAIRKGMAEVTTDSNTPVFCPQRTLIAREEDNSEDR